MRPNLRTDSTSRSRPRRWLLLGGILLVPTIAAAVGRIDDPRAVSGVPIPPPKLMGRVVDTPLQWRLNTPTPAVVPASRANPSAVADKFAARADSIDQRSALRAFEGAPPVIPHPIADVSVTTCRACHGQGLRAGEKLARMMSHTYLTNCTQCHVERPAPSDAETSSINTFMGRRASGFGGLRAWTGAPPVMPHALFMRTNCVSCHGEFGYDGWRPDHLSRSNCVQCHAAAAEFEQLGPAFGVADGVAGGDPLVVR